jgi:hypothetical protein
MKANPKISESYKYYMKNITTIVVEKEVKDKLKKLGSKGETYNKIINRLIKNADNKI